MVDDRHFVLTLNDAQSIHHLTVFLTQPFPDGSYAATCHFLWPQQEHQHPQSAQRANDWKLLGMLSNEKPSAIFKVQRPPSSIANDGTSSSSSIVGEHAPSNGMTIDRFQTAGLSQPHLQAQV